MEGLELGLRYDAEVWAVQPPRGSGPRGHANGLLTIDLDLQTAAGTLGLVVVAPHGGNPSDSALDLGAISNIAGISTVRLFELFYALELGASRLRVGMLAIDDDFMVIERAALFVQSGFGTPQTLALNLPAPIYPLGALGVTFEADVTSVLQFELGVYDADAGDPRAHPWIGDLALRSEQGGVALAELRLRFAGAELQLGGLGRLGPQPVAAVHLSIEGTLLAQADWQLEGFLRGAWAHPSEEVVAEVYLDAGLQLGGLGLGLASTRFGPGAGRRRHRQGWETVLELTYRWVVLEQRLSLQPDLQWVSQPAAELGSGHALAAGLRATASW